MGRLQGKVALITGSTGGIGEEASRVFAREGASVMVAGRNVERGVEVARSIVEAGGTADFCALDVRSWDSWASCMTRVLERFGKINVLVNNAGISFRETVDETTPASWDETIATNQTGVFYGIKQGIEAMRSNGEKCSIVNTSSVDGIAGDAVFFSYCAAKAAVSAMTRCAALSCGAQGLPIRVNAVAPGYILTPMALEDAIQNNQTIEEYSAQYANQHPIGHLGSPADIAYAYLYLASDEADFVTGTTLMVDGGYTAQ
ncbi:MAG: glucose 1-dehydrogenase [Eggerthellaceae bacterium]|nr:glucose 1-dehydrogenase [Eggerthellaceae bacterium]